MTDYITVAEFPAFTKWADKSMTEDDREALLEHLAANPKAGELITGSGGLRKVRWSRPSAGKSGGVRVIYYFYDPTVPLYLVTGYAKNVKDDLSAKDLATFRKLVEAIKAKARSKAIGR